ncbi:MAG: hypothetical protein C4524_01245, partial [Candidatus Zixiibacteriota bacterium]
VYDLQGNLVRTLIADKFMLPGGCSVAWNGKNERGSAAASGMYLAEIQVDAYRQTKKMILLR